MAAAMLKPPVDVRLMNALATLIYAAVVVGLLAAGVLWVLRQPAFSLEGIRVDGELTHTNAVTLRANVAPKLSGNFLTTDLASARAAFESMPWVRKAVVRREFPGHLHVTLTEQKPVAFWGDPTESRLMNNYGEVFEANTAEVDETMPRLRGPLDQAHRVFGMYQVLEPLFQPHELNVDELRLSNRGSWQVLLDGGAVLELGRGNAEEVTTRTQRFLETLTRVTDKYGRTVDALESADLRHRDAYALRLRGITTVSDEPTPVPKKKK